MAGFPSRSLPDDRPRDARGHDNLGAPSRPAWDRPGCGGRIGREWSGAPGAFPGTPLYRGDRLWAGRLHPSVGERP